MTRETKIGLLVGLAFIIVIGILLSDYNRNDTQPAALALVGDNVRAGSATMHNGSGLSEVVLPPVPAAPVRPVPTHDEVHPETRIDIGPGPAAPTPAAPTIVKPVTPANQGDETNVNPPSPEPRDNPLAGEGGSTPRTAPQIPGTVPVEPRRNAEPPVVRDMPPSSPTVNGAKQYVAISGDTVSKLAGRFLGANTKTNREAILAINPTLKQNPNNVIVGRTYMIPATASKPAAATGATPTPVAPEHPVAVVPKPPAGPQYFYTVKENDNLWRIAESQLGDGNAWAAIKDLNKDILKGKDDLRPNMRLRLPAKPVATIE